MALVVADRVKETTTSTGTGAITLGGAEPNFRTFSSVLSDADTTYYAIIDDNNLAFEVGLGTYASSGNTITRTTVLASSNSNNAVNFSAGTKDVFLTYPADKSVNRDASGNVSVSGGVTATSFTGNITGNVTGNVTGAVTATQVDLTGQGDLRLQDASGGQYVALQAPATVGSSFTFTLPSADGSADQLLKTDGSGNLSFATINPAPSFTATADGAIANGDTLIVTSAGKLKPAGIDIVNVNPPVRNATKLTVDSGYAYPGGNASYAFDTTTNQTAVFFSEFQSGSRKSGIFMVSIDDGIGAAATLSKGSFNQLVGSNSYIDQYEMLYDPDISKLVIFYKHQSSTRLYAVVGTVSGTSVTFATAVEASTDSIDYCRAAYDTTNNKYIVVYKRGSNLYGRVVSISGTTPSFESEVTIYDLEQGVDSQNITIAFSPDDDKFIVAFQNDAVSTNSVRCRSLAISGSSITVGTDTQILSGNVQITKGNNLKMVYDTEHDVFCMTYTRSTNSYYVDFRTLSINGSGVTVGSEYTVVSVGQSGSPVNLTFNATDGKCYIGYKNSSNANYIISFDAGSNTAGTALKVSADTAAYQSYVEIVYDSHRQKMVMTGDNGYNNDLESYMVSGTDGQTNLTAENYVGIADAAYSDGDTATCQTVGAVDDAQSSLTPGQLYYVQNNGSLSTSAGSPSVVGGVAIASTKLLITRS